MRLRSRRLSSDIGHPVRCPWSIPDQLDIQCRGLRQDRADRPAGAVDDQVTQWADRRGHAQFDANPFRGYVFEIDKTKVDDIHAELRVIHGAQRRAHLFLGGQPRVG